MPSARPSRATPPNSRRPHFRATALALLILCHASPVCAQIATDGKLGVKTKFGGTFVTIPPSLGRQVDGNLFHSFRKFNVAPGQLVTLEAPAPVSRVLLRVTGRAPSNINGTLSCPADLYLINPAGISIGSGAFLDVSGAFVATTADWVQLSDGRRFDARATAAADALLTSAPPQAFGFLRAAPGPIHLTGTFNIPLVLAAPPDKRISLVGGGIRIENAALIAKPGQIDLVSGAGPGFVTLGPPAGAPAMSAGMARGPIVMTGADIDADVGGRVYVRAADMQATAKTRVHSVTAGAGPPGLIDIDVTGALSLNDSTQILTNTQGSGRAGDVRISARDVYLRNLSAIASDSGSVDFRPEGSGGSVHIFTDRLGISTASTIQSLVYGAGDGGVIDIHARDSLGIDGQNSSGTAVRSETIVGSSGDAGTLTVNAGELTLLNTAQITSTTRGRGRAGDIHLHARSMTLDGGAVPTNPTLVQSRAGTTTDNRGGNIFVTVQRDLRLLGGGVISATTFGRGNGGDVDVRTRNLLARGAPGIPFTGVFARSASDPASPPSGFGRAGSIRILAGDSVVLRDGGQISVFAEQAAAGSITLSAPAIDLAERRPGVLRGLDAANLPGEPENTRITTQAASGNSGTITINTPGRLTLFNSFITARAGNAGTDVTIMSRGVPVVALNQSIIDGRAISRDVHVAISPSAQLIRSADSRILSDNTSLPPDLDLAGALINLPASLFASKAGLQEACIVRFDTDASSFTVTGRGALSIEPGGLIPSR